MSRILTTEPLRDGSLAASPDADWRALGRFGGGLAVLGLLQLAVYLYPPAFGSLEWQFSAAVQVLGALALPALGLVAVQAAAGVLGSRRVLLGSTVLLLSLTLAIVVLLLLFWLVVPIAARNTPPNAQVALRQAIMRASISGIGFGLLLGVAGLRGLARLKELA